MSRDPTLQVRRWFERRPVILAAAAAGLVAVAVTGEPGLSVLPVMLAALEIGLVGGLVTAGAVAAFALASGAIAPAVAVLAVGAVAGRFSDQMRSLLEQRRGFGQLLDAQEDDRRRHADRLHEELAQMLAAVLLNLRMLRRQGVDGESLDELHDQVAGVLEEIRELATELRPSSLASLGLVPALEALGVEVEADEPARPLPEPLRTGVYRLVEDLAPARVRLSTTGHRLDLVADAPLAGHRRLAAARGRAALLGGSVRVVGDGSLHAKLPLQRAGSIARTTVLPAAESISS
jgi:hypothetical protein